MRELLGNDEARAAGTVHVTDGLDALSDDALQARYKDEEAGEAFEPIDVRDSVSAALAMMEPQLKNREVRITRTMPREPVMVRCDRIRLEQVIINLIRNAIQAAHETVDIPSSRLKSECARILAEQGYIDGYDVVAPDADHPGELIRVRLKYTSDRRSAISGLKRVSRPGRRVYARKDRLPRVLGGLGTAILSTSTGLITSRQAAERGIGGEVIAFVW